MPEGTKRDNPCLANAADDEPIFVLRGTDPFAPDLVRRWAISAAQHNINPEKVRHAYEHAGRMEHYNQAHGKLPD